MNSKAILNIEKPVTQTTQAVCALLAWKGRSSNPLPEFVEMGAGDSRLVLVLSNKRDAYYTTTARNCSCPAANWHPNQRCKHQRWYFPEEIAATKSPAAIRQPNHGAWHGHNGPVIEGEVRSFAKAAASPLYMDRTPDVTQAEIAYFERKEAVEFLPMEA
jgi:hypothetical protein